MVELIVLLVFGVFPMLATGICYILGKGTDTIAGYFTMGAEERAKYDMKKVGRFTGWFLILMSFLMLLIGIGLFLEAIWLYYAAIAALGVSILVWVFLDDKKKFLKEKAEKVQ